MLDVVANSTPDEMATMLECAAGMAEGGEMKPEALVKLIKSVENKSPEELDGILGLIPEPMAMLKPFVRPMSGIPEQQLLPLVEAITAVKQAQDNKEPLPVDAIKKGHTAFKAIPESNRRNLVDAAKASPVAQFYP